MSKKKDKQIRNYINKLKELGIDESFINSIQQEIKGRIFTDKNKSSMKLTKS